MLFLYFDRCRENGGPGFPKIYEYHHTQVPLNIHYLKHFSTTLIHHCYGGMASEFSPAQPPAVLNHLEIKQRLPILPRPSSICPCQVPTGKCKNLA
jgi:hypothetical protein